MAKWDWHRFLSMSFMFPLPVPFHQRSKLLFCSSSPYATWSYQLTPCLPLVQSTACWATLQTWYTSVFRKKPCTLGVATVNTQFYPSNGKEFQTAAFKDPYLPLFPCSCAQNLSLHSVMYFRNTISMPQIIKLKSRELILTVSCSQQSFEHLFI